MPLCPADFPSASVPYGGDAQKGGADYLCANNRRKVVRPSGCEVARFVGLAEYAANYPGVSADGGAGALPAHILTRGFQRPAGQGAYLNCDAPAQSFPAGAQDSANPENWRCADTFIVEVKKK